MSFPFHFAEGPPNRFFLFYLPSSLSLSPPPFFPIFPRLDPYYYNKYSCVFLRPFFHSPTLPSFPPSFYFPYSTLFSAFFNLSNLLFTIRIEIKEILLERQRVEEHLREELSESAQYLQVLLNYTALLCIALFCSFLSYFIISCHVMSLSTLSSFHASVCFFLHLALLFSILLRPLLFSFLLLYSVLY